MARLASRFVKPPKESIFLFNKLSWITQSEEIARDSIVRERIVKFLGEKRILLYAVSLANETDYEGRLIAMNDICQLCCHWHLTVVTANVCKDGIRKLDKCPKCKKNIFQNLFISKPNSGSLGDVFDKLCGAGVMTVHQ